MMQHRTVTATFLMLLLVMSGGAFGQQTQETKKLDQAISGERVLPAADTLDDRMARMEALLNQQHEEIETLRLQLGTSQDDRLDKARAEDIRQTLQELLADEEFRSQIYQPTLQAGYDRGFYIRTTDDSFYMKTRIRTQFRYTGINRQHRNRNVLGFRRAHSTSAFEFPRLRLYFTGWMFNKDLRYVLGFEGSTNNQDGRARLYDAYFDYQYAKGHHIRWGQFHIPFSKQGVYASSFNQMLVDVSMPSAVFGVGQSLGIMAHGKLLDDNVTYRAGIFNGANNPYDDASRLDTRFATAARVVWHVLPGYNEGEETAIAMPEKPVMDIGGSFFYNQRDRDFRGQNLVYNTARAFRAGRGPFATASSLGTEVLQLGADVGFKYRRLSLGAEYYFRNVRSDDRLSQWNQLTVRGRGNSSPQGGYVQAGYFLIPEKLELAGRLGGVWGMGDTSWEKAVGVNYYIRGHALKIQADVTHINDAPINSRGLNLTQNDNIWMYRVQVQATMD